VTQGTIMGAGISAFVLLCYATVSLQLQPIAAAVAADDGARPLAEATTSDSGGGVPSGQAAGSGGANESPGQRSEPALAMTSEVGGAARAGRDWQSGATQAEIDRILTERGIEFDAGSSHLSDAGRRTVDRLVALLVVEPEARVRIAGRAEAGHAGPEGQQGALQRATAVRQYLIESGIAAERLRAEAAEEATAAGQAAADGRDARTIEVHLEEGR